LCKGGGRALPGGSVGLGPIGHKPRENGSFKVVKWGVWRAGPEAGLYLQPEREGVQSFSSREREE